MTDMQNRFNPDGTPGGKGKRFNKRLNCNLPVIIQVGDNLYQGKCRDIGPKGMGLMLPSHFPLFEQYEVQIKVNPANQMAVSVSEVFRKQEHQSASTYVIGVEVLNHEGTFGALYRQARSMYDQLTLDPKLTNFSRPFDERAPKQDNDPSAELFDHIPTNPTRIGSFIVLEKLGQGSIATTFRAKDPQNRLVALKVIHPHFLKQAGAREKWLDYLTDLRDLHHEGLLPIHDIGVLPDGKNIYYTSPFRTGHSLAHHAEQAIADEKLLHHSHVLRWMGQLTATLSFLHEMNHVVLNLKPSNLLLNDEGKIELCDPAPPFELFDAAARKNFLSKASPTMLHADVYAALCTTEPVPRTPWHDIHAFGGCLDYLLAGRWGNDPSAGPMHIFERKDQNLRADQFLDYCQAGSGGPIKDGSVLKKTFKQAFSSMLTNAGKPAAAIPLTTKKTKSNNTLYMEALEKVWVAGHVPKSERSKLEALREELSISRQDALLLEEQIMERPDILEARKQWRRARRVGRGQGDAPPIDLELDTPMTENPSAQTQNDAAGIEDPVPPHAQSEGCEPPIVESTAPKSNHSESKIAPLPTRYWFIDALIYPARNHGLVALGVAAFIAAFLQGVARLAGIFSFFAVFLISIILIGYATTFAKLIVVDTSEGKKSLPEFPDFEDFFSTIVHPALQYFTCFLVCLGPSFGFMTNRIINIVFPDETAQTSQIQHDSNQNDAFQDDGRSNDPSIDETQDDNSDSDALTEGNDVQEDDNDLISLIFSQVTMTDWLIFYTLLVIGLFYLPMGCIAVSLIDSVGGLSPTMVIPGIFKAFPDYLVVLVIVFFFYFIGNYAATMATFIGGFLGRILGMLVFFYSHVAIFRVLGLHYHKNEHKLDWF